MNWHYGYIILCHLLPSVYLNSHHSTQTHRSLCHAHKASVQGSQCLPFPPFLFLLFHPLCLHSPWTWSLAMDRSSTALEHRLKGNYLTITKEFALENKVCSFAKLISIQENEVSDHKGGRREREKGKSGGQQTGVICWSSYGTEKEKGTNRLYQPSLLSWAFSLLHSTFSCVSKGITVYFKVRWWLWQTAYWSGDPTAIPFSLRMWRHLLLWKMLNKHSTGWNHKQLPIPWVELIPQF